MLTTLAFAAIALPSSQVMLSHTYEKDTADKYRFEATAGPDFTIDAEFTIRVTKVSDEGAAFDFTIDKFKASQDIEAQGKTYSDVFDKFGMPKSIKPKDELIMLVLLSASSYMPGTQVKDGSPFKIDWKAKDDLLVVGQGTLNSTDTTDGMVKVAYEATITPKELTPAKFKATSVIQARNGKLISSTGTLTVGSDGEFKFKITKIAK